MFDGTRCTLAGQADDGQTIVEYALIVATISVAAIGVLVAMTDKIGVVFDTLANAL